MNLHRLWSILLCLLLAAALAGCVQAPVVETVAPTQTQPDLSATAEEVAAVWEPAAAELEALEEIAMVISLEDRREEAGHVLVTDSQSRITYLGRGSRDPLVQLEETLTIGGYESQYTAFYGDGKAWCRVGGSDFWGKMRESVFLKNNPIVTAFSLDLVENYGKFTLETTQNGTVITFCDAFGLEGWVTAEAGELITANGAVQLDSQGKWCSTQYFAEYRVGERVHEVQITVERLTQIPQIQLPQEETAVNLSDISLPKKLLQLVGEVYGSNALHSVTEERMYCQAADLDRTQTIGVFAAGSGEAFRAAVTHRVALLDYTHTLKENQQNQWYANGQYHYGINGTEQVLDRPAQEMQAYCQDLCLQYLLTPQMLAGAEADREDYGTVYTLAVTEEALESLYDRVYRYAELDLDSYAPDHTDNQAQLRITVSKEDPLEITVEILLSRTHNIYGEAYETGYQVIQTLRINDPDTLAALEAYLAE